MSLLGSRKICKNSREVSSCLKISEFNVSIVVRSVSKINRETDPSNKLFSSRSTVAMNEDKTKHANVIINKNKSILQRPSDEP